MRSPTLAAVIVVTTTTLAQAAQQDDERVRAALRATFSATAPVVGDPAPKSWGGVSLSVPDSSSRQMVAVKIPVGELAMKAARSVVVAHRARAEQKAHEEVLRDLQHYVVSK
jgi:hypothetical protein